MRVLIIGAGRMGVRHALGVKSVTEVTDVLVSDISQAALDAARDSIGDARFSFCLSSDLPSARKGFDVCIIAATAGNRQETLDLAGHLGCQRILVEKPLGQSIAQVEELVKYVEEKGLSCSVNLNMRLYDSFSKLRNDLATLPQFKGELTFTINTGTLGIGANGIHYLDLLFHLMDADAYSILAAEIDDVVIPSGRGPQFGDFGGWAVIRFSKNGESVGKALVSMSARSTAFGSWEIVGPHGRIFFNEVEGKRITVLRKPDSEMPMQRYHADYLSPETSEFVSPFLGDMTAKWIHGLLRGESLLPNLKEALPVHRLMFEWLSKREQNNGVFPIT
jgi:predicted dehydrogenase